MCSTQTSITPTTSGSHSSCTTPLPWTTPPPTAITMRPGSHSSCFYDDERKNYDELPPHKRRGPFTACTNSGAANNIAAVLTSRSAFPHTNDSAGKQQFGTTSSSRVGATGMLFKPPGLFLLRLLLLFILNGFQLDPGITVISNQHAELIANFNPVTIVVGTLPSGPTRPWL